MTSKEYHNIIPNNTKRCQNDTNRIPKQYQKNIKKIQKIPNNAKTVTKESQKQYKKKPK